MIGVRLARYADVIINGMALIDDIVVYNVVGQNVICVIIHNVVLVVVQIFRVYLVIWLNHPRIDIISQKFNLKVKQFE